MKKITVFLVIMLVASMVLSGCFLTDKLASLKQSFNKADNEEEDTTTPTVIIENPAETPVVSGETKTISLYFADETGEKLVLEERVIPKVVGIARAAMEELIKGPVQAGLKPTLPASCQLLDINIKPDGMAIVDFSGELIKDLPASAQTERMAVYSIVNTLTQFPTVQEVELRIDGKRVDTLLGHVKWNQKLLRNASLIK